MRVTQDKFNEVKYNFAKLKAKFKEIEEEVEFINLLELINEFRFDLNSFVNSYRSTTFTLQAEHKSKHGDIFIKWYETARKKITDDEFSKIITELRNINQKEGNIYPTFQFKGETDKAIVYFELDLANKDSNFITTKQIEWKNNISFELESTSNNPNEISHEDKMKLLKISMELYTSTMNEIHEQKKIKLDSIKIDRFNKKYSPEEFKKNLNRMGYIMQEIIEEGWTLFK